MGVESKKNYFARALTPQRRYAARARKRRRTLVMSAAVVAFAV
jgi:hypothetical protein